MNRKKSLQKRKAFTLIEILIVIALMAFLASLVVGNIAAQFSTAREQVAQTFVKSSLEAPLMTYSMKVGSFPSTEEGLQALIKAPESAGDRWGNDPYIKDGKVPEDPWGSEYRYAYPGTHNPSGYDLWSIGPDKKDGTDDDIGNWPKEKKQ